jgi:hypothetical protein
MRRLESMPKAAMRESSGRGGKGVPVYIHGARSYDDAWGLAGLGGQKSWQSPRLRATPETGERLGNGCGAMVPMPLGGPRWNLPAFQEQETIWES